MGQASFFVVVLATLNRVPLMMVRSRLSVCSTALRTPKAINTLSGDERRVYRPRNMITRVYTGLNVLLCYLPSWSSLGGSAISRRCAPQVQSAGIASLQFPIGILQALLIVVSH